MEHSENIISGFSAKEEGSQLFPFWSSVSTNTNEYAAVSERCREHKMIGESLNQSEFVHRFFSSFRVEWIILKPKL